ncbi:hypothetical protein V6Z11_D10G228900 [Gossypium hirsutum]
MTKPNLSMSHFRSNITLDTKYFCPGNRLAIEVKQHIEQITKLIFCKDTTLFVALALYSRELTCMAANSLGMYLHFNAYKMFYPELYETLQNWYLRYRTLPFDKTGHMQQLTLHLLHL